MNANQVCVDSVANTQGLQRLIALVDVAGNRYNEWLGCDDEHLNILNLYPEVQGAILNDESMRTRALYPHESDRLRLAIRLAEQSYRAGQLLLVAVGEAQAAIADSITIELKEIGFKSDASTWLMQLEHTLKKLASRTLGPWETSDVRYAGLKELTSLIAPVRSLLGGSQRFPSADAASIVQADDNGSAMHHRSDGAMVGDSPKMDGEWSLPMPKAEIMTRIHLKPHTFKTFTKQHPLRQINRQLWQIRLDGMDKRTRGRIETGR